MKSRNNVVVWSILCGSLAMGCNVAIDATPGIPLPASSGSGGLGGGGGGGGGGQGGSNGNGGSGGEGGSGEVAMWNLDICVLDKAGPTGTCNAEDIMKFGSVTPGMDATRFGRIENKSAADTTILSSVLEGLGIDLENAFEVTFARYEKDPVSPGVFQKIVVPLATLLAPGEMLFVEVKLTTPLLPGPLPDIKLIIATQFAGVAAPDLAVPIQGEISNCASGTGDCDGSPQTVCETDLLTSADHCGQCGSPCDLSHASSSCTAGQCMIDMCAAGFVDCDTNPTNGCEVQIATDPAHCGTCVNQCSVAHGTPGCSASACTIQSCDPNYYDVDKIVANGCECHKTSTIDLPDDGFVDSNCDGIDGTESAAIFVATPANGGKDSNPGTKALPVASVINAVAKAMAGGKTQILVSEGTYSGRVTVVNKISIYGGYKALTWTRSAANAKPIIESTSDLSGRRSAVEGYNLTSATTLDRLSIRTTSTGATGVSNYAMYCKSCGSLTLKNSVLVAGNAGAGLGGVAGGNGGDGTVGAQGGQGSCGGGPGAGGSAGGSSCGRNGGTGGNGGPKSQDGSTGASGAGGTPGGAGGAQGNPGKSGVSGGVGNGGAAGTNGQGGSGGGLSATFFWLGTPGIAGANGAHGNGGGGGGGGGGEKGTLDNGGGNGGGGGGGGGCGATAGTSGTAGGGSFGLFLVNSTGAFIQNSTINSGTGGAGGSGAIGGIGGAGGQGGLGNTYCNVDVGNGGNGGPGGNGGNSGHGGGGAGGPSYAIYKYMSSFSSSGITLAPGSGGLGGNSPGNQGAQGASGATN